jgi:hypothetical protein
MVECKVFYDNSIVVVLIVFSAFNIYLNLFNTQK